MAEFLEVCVFDNLSTRVIMHIFLLVALALPLKEAACSRCNDSMHDVLDAVGDKEDANDALHSPHLFSVQVFAHQSLVP